MGRVGRIIALGMVAFLVAGCAAMLPGPSGALFSQLPKSVHHRTPVAYSVLSPVQVHLPNVSVDFTSVSRPVSPLALGVAETGYEAPNVLATDATEQKRLGDLGVAYIRMHLVFSVSGAATSKIVCGGAGCDTGPTGDQWITSIKAIGAQPVVIVNTSSAVDAANMVRHFNIGVSTPNAVRYWIIGNEPDLHGYSPARYAAAFNADVNAMKAVDPTIKVGGPTTAWFDHPFLQSFLQTSGTHVDFLDFHAYPQQGCSTCTPSTSAALFAWASATGAAVATAHAMAKSTTGHDLPVEVGEWSLDWGGPLQTRTHLNTVWSADVLGQIIGHGGISLHFGTKGNLLEWASGYYRNEDTRQSIFEGLDDPHAPYEGYTMFSGAGLFPRFGQSFAVSSTTLRNVDIFASTGSQRNIVVVNKDTLTAKSATFSLKGNAERVADEWQRAPGLPFNAPPTHIGTIAISKGTFSATLPPLSVTTFALRP